VDGRKKKEDSTKGLVTLAGLVKLHIVGQKNIGLIGAQEAYTSPICFQPVLLCVGFFFKSYRRSMFGVCLLGLASYNDILSFNYCSLIDLPLKF
jgi:hypothetical protein